MVRHCLMIYCQFRRRLTDKSGATAIEYALIAGGVAIAIVAAVFVIGDSVGSVFTDVNTQGFGG